MAEASAEDTTVMPGSLRITAMSGTAWCVGPSIWCEMPLYPAMGLTLARP